MQTEFPRKRYEALYIGYAVKAEHPLLRLMEIPWDIRLDRIKAARLELKQAILPIFGNNPKIM